MKRLALLILALGFAGAQESDVHLSPPSYIFAALNVSTVAFDFTAEVAPAPGALSLLAADAYPNDYPGGFPSASEPNWKACLGLDEEASGRYLGSPTPPTTTPEPCRFAPSAVSKQAFLVNYYGLGRPPCDQDLKSDADLLIVTNRSRWRVKVRLDRAPPSGLEPHLLPLTVREPDTLCKYLRVTAPKRRHDFALSTSAKSLSLEPDPGSNRRKTRRSYFTPYRALYTLPMLYYLQIDRSSLDPAVLDGTTEIRVTYIVRNRR